MVQKVFKGSNLTGFNEKALVQYIKTLDGDVQDVFRWIQISRKRSIVFGKEQILASGGSPTATTAGTTPTIGVFQLNATTELLSIFFQLPVDWDKQSNVSFDLVCGLRANETNGDDLDLTYDYVTISKNTTGAGLAKTSTAVTTSTELTTANGLASGDIYVVSRSLDKNDANNGWGFGDSVTGIGIEFHLTNTTTVADISIIGGQLNYTASY